MRRPTKRQARRDFLKGAMAAGLAFELPGLAIGGERRSKAAGPNDQVRIAIIGLGGINTVGGVGGRGRQLMSRLREIPEARIVALCDVDQEILDHELQQCKDQGDVVAGYRDLRKVLEDKNIDAVAVATPNHWHALATIWACQAGKDVYVEKPFSYDLWEGAQMVAAARKFRRIVQNGTQSRSSQSLRQAFEYLRSGQLGAVRYAHALVYRARDGMGKAAGPLSLPPTVDFDLWCGPIAKTLPVRKQLHYDWHWFWATGNGEIGNNGAHLIDVGRWALGQDGPPPRAISLGGRFGFNDGGETPNTQIAVFDYKPAPLLCEIRNLRTTKSSSALGKFRNTDRGVVIDCEGGYFAGDSSGGAVFDRQGKKIKQFDEGRKPQELETAHVANFVAAVRSRKPEDLKAEALEGYRSAACSHMANLSYRLGAQSPPEAILTANRENVELSDAFERCREYLQANGVDLSVTQAVAGPWLTFDSRQEKFVGAFAEQANKLSHREYRAPFTVPKLT